jgi:hypothetical protein
MTHKSKHFILNLDIVVPHLLAVTYAKVSIGFGWARTEPHFGWCWTPCHNQSEGCKYADLLVIREGLTGFVELVLQNDDGCGHDDTCIR